MVSDATYIFVFDDRDEAERAYDELETSGFSHEDMGFALRGRDAVRGGMITDTEGTKDGAGALSGAATGGLVGGMIGAAVAVLLPGAGTLLAGGILASALGGAAAGAATGGIVGALAGLGISEDEAIHYQRAFDEGKALIFVRPGDRLQIARDIVQRHGGYAPHMQR